MAPVPTSQRSAQALAELIEQLFRRIHGASFVEGLVPAQWGALRFLHRANPSARTLSAFTQFHATSKGTAAQTLRALRAKGLIRQHQSSDDRRVRYYELTDKGERLMGQDPLRPLVEAIRTLPGSQAAGLALSLQGLVQAFFSPPAPTPNSDD